MSVDWPRLYRTTFPDLVRYLHRKLRDPERAHDLAQEAFLRGLDQEGLQDPRGWLFTVAGNLARDELRKVIRRRKHLALLRAESRPEDPARSPLDEVERREAVERAQEALGALGERDREVLLLWDAGLSYGRIAESTGLSPGAVGTTLARARRRLNEVYRELAMEGGGPSAAPRDPSRPDPREEDDVARG